MRNYDQSLLLALLMLLSACDKYSVAADSFDNNRLRGSTIQQQQQQQQLAVLSSVENVTAFVDDDDDDQTSLIDLFFREESTNLNPRRYFARYSNSQGRQMVRSCASRIIEDDDDTDFTIFQRSSDDSSLDCLHLLQRHSAVLSMEEDHPAWAFATGLGPADSVAVDASRHLQEQTPWGITAIQADALDQGKSNVTICVVDTGVAAKHPDLHSDHITGVDNKEKNWMWDEDRAGHGTHVAGTIAAAGGNNIGVQGVGNYNLLVVRGLGDSATGYESDIWKAVQICVDKKVDVINLSLGTVQMSNFAKDLYTKAVEEYGIIIVAAAGNSADTTKYYPASHPSVISVGAVKRTGRKLYSSVSNDQIEFAAPGEDILSTSVASHAVHTPDGWAFGANRVVGVPDRPVTGNLVPCSASSTCDDAEGGGICLIDIAGIYTSRQQGVLNGCRSGGGAGAVFYDSSEKQLDKIAVMYISGSDSIPAICISKRTASALLRNLRENDDSTYEVTIGDDEGDGEEYTWETRSGTSMASPHVAASFALLKSHFPSCSNHQLRYALAHNAEHPYAACDKKYGYGMIKVKDTYDWLLERGGCDWEVPQKSRGGCTTLD